MTKRATGRVDWRRLREGIEKERGVHEEFRELSRAGK